MLSGSRHLLRAGGLCRGRTTPPVWLNFCITNPATQGERTETINELKSLLQQVGACGDIWIAAEFPRAVTALFFNYWIPVSSHIYFCYALVDGP